MVSCQLKPSDKHDKFTNARISARPDSTPLNCQLSWDEMTWAESGPALWSVLNTSTNPASWSKWHEKNTSGKSCSVQDVSDCIRWRRGCTINALDSKGNCSATSNNTKLVHWPNWWVGCYIWYSEVQRRGDWAGSSLSKCNSPPING